MSSAQDSDNARDAQPRILVAAASGIATITINRARQLNALTKAMWEQLAAEVTRLDSDESVRVLVIRGAGGKAFSAGADIREFRSHAGDPGWVSRQNTAVTDAEDAIAAATKPTIAMVEGHCLGGGCAIAVACDLRIAADTSQFAVPVAKLGLVYSLAATRRLVDLVGPSQAKFMLFSARTLPAADACRIGLVNRVLEASVLEDETYSLAATISSGSELTIRSAKEIVRLILEGVQEDNAHTTAMQASATASDHYRNAVAAFAGPRSTHSSADDTP